MSSPIRLSEPGARSATFEQPFEMLQACHERVHRMLALLGKLRDHITQHGADDQARQAARDVMRYFDQAAPQHHRDEELHVFPPLLAQGEPKTVEIVKQLQHDHEQMESGWQRARQLLAAVAEGQLQALTPDQGAALDAFAGLYAQHITHEETIAYPQVRQLVDDSAIKAMGEEMAKRRGIV